MTEKIIINGVDVSGCEFRTTRFLGYEGQNYCEIYDCVCEEPIGDDCDHKQLQRTTVQYNTVVEQNKSLQRELKQKQQECEGRLKERDNVLDECIRYQEEMGKLQKSQFCIAYEKDCYKECKQGNCAIKNSYRYKQALDEIEKIITPVEYPDVDRKINYGSVCHTQILDIINNAKEVQCE